MSPSVSSPIIVSRIDPPSFSRGAKGKPFSVAKDLKRLFDAAIPFVAPGGHLFFSTNYAQWDRKALERELHFTEEKLPEPPIDFQWEENPLKAFLFSF